MRVTLTGTGISQGVPVVGCGCSVCHSDDPRDRRLRAAAVLTAPKGNIAIDIGPDFRQQMLTAGVTTLAGVLLTHEHSDHVAGLDDIRPFNFSAREGAIPFYGEERVMRAIKARFPYAFAPPGERYPGAPEVRTVTLRPPFSPFSLAGVEVLPLRVQHGSLPILGYRVGNFAYITDCSHLPRESMARINGLDVLVINALRREKHPMHFTLREALAAIKSLAPRRAYLTHISHEMGFSKELELELPQGVFMGYDGLTIEVG